MGSSASGEKKEATVVDVSGLSPVFEREGLIRCLDVMTPDNAARYAAKLGNFVTSQQDHRDFSDWIYGKTHLLLSWVAELATEEALLDAVEALIGPDILLWDSSIPLKAPHSGGYFGWHQDGTYWPIEPLDQVVSVWLALGPVGRRNGGMRMIPGSHRLGQLPHRKTFDEKSMLRRGQRVAVPMDDASAIDIELEPGQASFHHTLMLHGSGANQTESWRLGVILNFVAAAVGPAPGHEDSALLIRGSARQTRFTLDQRPESDLSADALSGYARAVERSSRRYRDVPAAGSNAVE